jgi:hypothetical protein
MLHKCPRRVILGVWPIIEQTMTLTVSLTPTARVLGPVTLIYGKEPQMGPCPICRVPKGIRNRTTTEPDFI